MLIEPKVKGFICTTAHPDGCKAHVKQQIDYVKQQDKTEGPKKVLVIGASSGYGLASRIAAAFSCGAATIGVAFEKKARGSRTATAGWYNCAAFEEFAAAEGLYAKTINGDAFSREIKGQTIEMIRRDLGTVDMVVYSLAAPRRTVTPGEGEPITYSSVIKTVGQPYTSKSIDLRTNQVTQVTVEPATQEEIDNTVKVMGGEDWQDWIAALDEAGVLADGAVTVAYSYIGPELTFPIYRNGSIGMAKRHLARTAAAMTEEYKDRGIRAYISVNKALVTQSSSAIPIVPLYISILFKTMQEMDLHEGCIQQMYRLFHNKLYSGEVELDGEGQIRLDDYEMRTEVQERVMKLWETVCDENLQDSADIQGYWDDFYALFGFRIQGVDYGADQETDRIIPSLSASE